jgi:hypothetical protein
MVILCMTGLYTSAAILGEAHREPHDFAKLRSAHSEFPVFMIVEDAPGEKRRSALSNSRLL